MKKIAFLLLLFVSTNLAFSQKVEPITGVFDLKFGQNLDDVRKKLTARGVEIEVVVDEGATFVFVRNVTMLDTDFRMLNLEFAADDKLKAGSFRKRTSFEETSVVFEKLKALLTAKYGASKVQGNSPIWSDRENRSLIILTAEQLREEDCSVELRYIFLGK